MYPLFGAAALFAMQVPRRTLAAYALAAAPLAIFWLARGFVRTGNPFYSLDLFSWFPTNEMFSRWRAHDRLLLGNPVASRDGWLATLRLFALFAPTALLGWILLPALRFRGRNLLAAATAVVDATLTGSAGGA